MRIYLFKLKWGRMSMFWRNIFSIVNYRIHFLCLRSHLNMILDLIFNWWMIYMRGSQILRSNLIEIISRSCWGNLDHNIMNGRSEFIILTKPFWYLNFHLIWKCNRFLMHWRLSSSSCSQNTSHFDLFISWVFHFIL